MRRVAFIFGCGPDGPDVAVCRHLVTMLDPHIEFIPRTLDNKKLLVEDCGPVADQLLKDSCERVLIIWDLYPPWRDRPPCRHEDREGIHQSLRNAGVRLARVHLVCICEEFEAWLLADERALRDFIARQRHPHPVSRIRRPTRPDRVRNPKARLTKLFNQELGQSRRYIDYQDAEPIVRSLPDLARVRRSPSFQRFEGKLST